MHPKLVDSSPGVSSAWQRRIFWLLWSAYASYYLCRVNFAVAQPAILKEFPQWTSTQIGAIPSVYSAFYAAGQFINGMIGQRVGARKMMTGALLVASTTNIVFSACNSLPVMMALWGLNGFAQSAGWSLVVQTMSNWTSADRRGTVMGLLSTCYQVGNVASWLLAGHICAALGWRAAFWVPSLLLVPIAIVFALFIRESPADIGLPPIGNSAPGRDHAGDDQETRDTLRIAQVLFSTLGNRILWVLGLGYFCMNAVRYAFMN